MGYLSFSQECDERRGTWSLEEEIMALQAFSGIDDLSQFTDQDIIGDFVGIEPLLFLGNMDTDFFLELDKEMQEKGLMDSFDGDEGSTHNIMVSPKKKSVVVGRRSKRKRMTDFSRWSLSVFFSREQKRNHKNRKHKSNPKHRQHGCLKRCRHCESEDTPLWRMGPMGPKTLCNACGVKFSKGRLFPEYRPANSPTFNPSIHSNSHMKVMEIRTHSKHQS